MTVVLNLFGFFYFSIILLYLSLITHLGIAVSLSEKNLKSIIVSYLVVSDFLGVSTLFSTIRVGFGACLTLVRGFWRRKPVDWLRFLANDIASLNACSWLRYFLG